MRLLLLGGTTEASALSRALAGQVEVTLSLAGRTRHPLLPPVAVRRGGFGGAEGLARALVEQRIDALLDATHPFAVRITANAIRAAGIAAVPLLVLRRPEWKPGPGDRWMIVADMPAAVAALGAAPQRVLLTIGQQDVRPFAAAAQHAYVIRSVEPPDPATLPPRAEIITARGPFLLDDELALMQSRGISVVVTKNSGGAATAAKLAAARALGLPVVMVARPPAPPVATVADVEQALAWVHGVAATLRGV